MAFTDEDKAKMDAAGDKAREAFDSLLGSLGHAEAEAVDQLIAWFAAHYMAAGYKRLGKILVEEAKGWTK